MNISTSKTVLITGGAKRIGRALTESLAESGWTVAIHYFGSSTEATDVARSIEEHGGRAAVFSADLSNTAETENLLPAVTAALGPVNALINNASIFEEENWDQVTTASWQNHLSVNLHAPFILSQAFARALPDNTEGAIVNVIDQRVFNLTPDVHVLHG